MQLVPVLLEPTLLQQVQDAARVLGVSAAAWLRQAIRQISLEDFPASWRAGVAGSRSHDSGYFGRKFGLCLDAVTSQKLEVLMQAFDRPAAEVIRQLIAQATLEDFPESWHPAADEQRHRETRSGKGDH